MNKREVVLASSRLTLTRHAKERLEGRFYLTDDKAQEAFVREVMVNSDNIEKDNDGNRGSDKFRIEDTLRGVGIVYDRRNKRVVTVFSHHNGFETENFRAPEVDNKYRETLVGTFESRKRNMLRELNVQARKLNIEINETKSSMYQKRANAYKARNPEVVRSILSEVKQLERAILELEKAFMDNQATINSIEETVII